MPIETFSQGGMTFQRNTYTGKLTRIDKPKKTVYIGVKKDSQGGVKTYSLTKSQSDSVKKNTSTQIAINKYFNDPVSQRQSIDPNQLKSKTIKPIVKNNRVWGYYDTQKRRTVGFSSPIEKRQYLMLEQSRQPSLTSSSKSAIGRGKVTPNASPSKFDNFINNAISLKKKANADLKSSYSRRFTDNTASINTVNNAFKVFVYTFIERGAKSAQSLGYLPATLVTIMKNPSVLKSVPREIARSSKDYLKVVTTSGFEGVAIVATDILILKGISGTLKGVSKVSGNVLARLNPKFVGAGKVGRILKIKLPKGKSVTVQVVAKMPKETLKSQVAKAGKTVTGISSQQNALVGVLKRSRVISKPISAAEAKGFSKITKSLLKKFDNRTISEKELVRLNNRLVKIEGTKGLLERSGFIDPSGMIRPSRLGLSSKGEKLLDYLSSNITFKKPKPQILLFDNLSVAKWPKNLLKVKAKLLKAKGVKDVSLTATESKELLKWQLSKPGQVKPLGFISGESELTIPPGSILKRVRKVGVTIIDGRRVPIVQAKIVKPTGDLKSLMFKWEKGVISKSELKQLDSLLKKSTGFKYGLSYSPKVNAKYVSIKRVLSSGAVKSLPKSKGYSVKRSLPSKVSKPSKASKPSRISKPSKASKVSIPSKPSKPSTPSKPSKVSKPSKPSRPSRGSGSSKSSRGLSSYSSSKLSNIVQKSKIRKRTKFTKDEVKYMVKLAYPKNRYVPSLAAIIFNITSFKVPKRITGFEIRPILKKR